MANLNKITKEILSYDKPFSYVEMINYLEKLGYDINECNYVFEWLYNDGLIHYEQVLPKEFENLGYAFITESYINKMIKDYATSKLKEINIDDEKVLNQVIDIAHHFRNNPYPKTKTR